MQIETKFASGEISMDRGQRDVLRRRFSQGSYAAAWAAANQSHGLKIEGNGKETPEPEQTETEHRKTERSQAETIYRAAASGKTSPEHVRAVSKVPYGYLAKDGVITYNGVTFVCDEKTNSICLGDMTDQKNVLNIPLAGGGHLKVNRDNIGDLSKAIGMFTPEDVNRILRAIHQDAKIRSVEQELEDMENSVGNHVSAGASSGETDEIDETEERLP